MLKERGKRLQLRFNIPNIPENKRNVERMLKQSLNAFKLFQHQFNILSARFNTVERGWQTLSTLPFNKIERMLKPFAKAFISLPSRRVIFLNSNFLHIIRVSSCVIHGECLLETRLFWSGACLSTTSINTFFQTSNIASWFASEKTVFHGYCATSLRKWWWLKFLKTRISIVRWIPDVSSLAADFKVHEDQRMIADTEMNYTRVWYFFGRTSYTEINQRSRGGCNSSWFGDQLTQSIYIKYVR